jgi:hypothetical protein
MPLWGEVRVVELLRSLTQLNSLLQGRYLRVKYRLAVCAVFVKELFSIVYRVPLEVLLRANSAVLWILAKCDGNEVG